MTGLNRTALTRLSSEIRCLDYDLDAVETGFVHIGVGGFHRAHQAMYVDRLLAAGHREWGICGVGVLPGDADMRDALREQDNLYTLMTVEAGGDLELRVVGSITEYLYAPDDLGAVVEKLASASTRIVTLTITESGYGVDDATGAFAPRDEATRADLVSDELPTSALGLLVAGLAARRERGLPPFTVLSCDNIFQNGRIARTAVVEFARHRDAQLADWIDARVAFPSSMVDRITPATDATVLAGVEALLGVTDRRPVRSESFAQWVVEDTFSNGRPPLESVGVQLASDVEPFEHMKLRLLNASHQMMSYLGILLGHRYVHEALADPDLSAFVASYLRSEAAPTLGPVPDTDVDAYIDQLLHRFSNLAIQDTLDRQIVDASVRIPTFVLPVVRDRLATHESIDHAALMLAAWCVCHERAATPMPDRDTDLLRRLTRADHDSPGALVADASLFGDLSRSVLLRVAYQRAKRSLLDLGPREAVRAVIGTRAGVR